MRTLSAMLLLAILAAGAYFMPAAVGQDERFSDLVDDEGTMRLPKDFRGTWPHLGSYVVMDEKAKGYGFHDVYANPEAVKAYRATGEWPDGATIVKEIRKVTTVKMTTGKSSYATENLIWFLMIKDAKGRFEDNPDWGGGWGWALFEAADPTKNVSKGWRRSCMGCHIPAKGDDWIYIEGYPTLKK